MPIWVAAIIGGLIEAAGSLVGKVLISMGLGYVTYSAVDVSITWARDQAIANLQGLGADAVGIMSALHLGQAVSILCSAVLLRMTFNGLTSGAVKKLVQK